MDWKNSEGAQNNEEISDEDLKKAANIFVVALCKKIFDQEEKKNV